MAGEAEKDEVFSDYAVFLKALLPPAQGFLYHDRGGRLFWSELPVDGAPELTDAYRAALATTLGGTSGKCNTTRLPLGNLVAVLLPLQGDAGRVIGALTVLLERSSAAMDGEFVRDVLGPALRSLQRELTLRFRVLDSQRKLQVQAAEERLLHQVEKILHDQRGCDAALRRLLALCQEHLGIEGVTLAIPEKRIALAQGDALSATEAELLSLRLLETATAPGFDPVEVQENDATLWVPVYRHARTVQGVLVLHGWQRSGFSRRRLARVARYVCSHIESLLERDYDPLTGLMAWPAFARELAAVADDDSCAVMYLDFDRLHVLNDTFGREAGDEALTRFAALLREMLPGRSVTRVTGDHFAVLLPATALEQARQLGQEICDRVREDVYVRGDQTYRATVSIGVGPVTVAADDAADGLAAARVACQAAKDRGRARVEVYEPADLSIIRRADDIQLVGYVRNAIENNRLALMGQRLLPLKDGRMSHYFEVLVRIVDDDGQHMPPAEFISAAERYQLMEELDRWVVVNTLQLIAGAGSTLSGEHARFAINLSGQSLGSDSFLPFVETAIRRSGVAPELIAFEITESVAVAKMQQAQAFMHALKKIGCRFSLDDFGTGLSSFAYLKLFPVDTLKIDGSFIRDVTSNVVSQSVVAAIAEVARVMQLETVAEYVQDQAGLDLLRSLNISYAQGFVIGTAEPLQAQMAAIGGAPPATKKRRAAPAAQRARP